MAYIENCLKKVNISIWAFLSFSITLGLCATLVFTTVTNRANVEKLTMEQLILEKSIKIHEVISKLLYKTHVLSAILAHNNGEIADFELVAATIADDPSIMNILIAPGGVVSDVYPREDNEEVIGLDFFSEGAGNKEAVLAAETGELVFGGPFDLVQGGQALVGRLPVYIDSDGGQKEFWGLVSVTLRYPEALDGAGLYLLEAQGYAYEIWRINPDDNERQIIAQSSYNYNKSARFIERHIPLLNADWYCRISPVRHWYEYQETWVLSFAGLMVSFFVGYVMQNNHELKLIKAELEDISRTDALTGIQNRRYFMELAQMHVERGMRTGGNCFVIMFDLDFFKETNDKYGHLAGDAALRDIAVRVKGMIRPYDLLARFGGEEFILLITDIERDMIGVIAERLRLGLSETPVLYEDKEIFISASFGVALSSPENGLEEAIKMADEALYEAKRKGRNAIVIYDEM